MLKRLKEQSITIVVATPYMDEAAMCDRIALMQNGKILKTATPREISDEFPEQIFEVKAGRNAKLLKLLEHYPDKEDAYAFGEFSHLIIGKNENFDKEKLVQYLKENGLTEIEINPTKATIEDSFILLLSEKNK